MIFENSFRLNFPAIMLETLETETFQKFHETLQLYSLVVSVASKRKWRHSQNKICNKSNEIFESDISLDWKERRKVNLRFS